MYSGHGNNKFGNAKNFIHKQADARLKEALPAMQRQGRNALHVDYVEALVYLRQPSATECTCRTTEVVPNEFALDGDVSIVDNGVETEISIDWSAPLFGAPNETMADAQQEYPDEYELEDDNTISTSAINNNPDCGLCYRTGFVPGFEQFGKQRIVLTTHDVVSLDGFTLNRTMQPHQMTRLAISGFVEFVITVPKYFKTCNYSIRNNHDVLNEKVSYAGRKLSLQDLEDHRGKQISIRIETTFTHVVFVFDMGTEPVMANVAQISKVTDWTQFDSTSSVSIILPTTIPDIPTGSVIVLPNKNLAFCINDVQPLRDSTGKNLDWNCNTRVLQPQEWVRSINKSFRLV